MAIDRTGKVTTTGLMGETTKIPKAPDLSGLTPPATARAQPKAMAEKPAPVEDQNLESKVNSLTDEEKVAIDTVLSPSVIAILKKIVPEVGPLLDRFGGNEENITLPVSVIKNYAIRKYGGANASESVEQFLTDLSNL